MCVYVNACKYVYTYVSISHCMYMHLKECKIDEIAQLGGN